MVPVGFSSVVHTLDTPFDWYAISATTVKRSCLENYLSVLVQFSFDSILKIIEKISMMYFNCM